MIRPPSIPLIALLVTAISCDARPRDTEEQQQPVIASNVIASNVIASNAITSNAIASGAIASNALAGALLPPEESGETLGLVTQPEVAVGLQDPDAQMLMKYLVDCALLPGQALRWTGRFAPFPTATWRGALGLCPEWLTNAPPPQCLPRVSGCLLARNNAFGISVPLSLRGDRDGVNALALAPSVGLWPKRWRTNTDVPSAKPCATNTLGLTRNCGWQSAGVGRCTPGQPVTVGAGGCGLGESTGSAMLRVCRRIQYCDEGSAELIAENDGACGSSKPRVDFTCPAEGFYAVMAARFASASGPAVVAVAADPPHFPSSEAQVFTWREGAFYGSIFGAGALNPLKPQVRVNPVTGRVEEQAIPGSNVWVPGKTLSSVFAGVVYQKMWACSSDNWSLPTAYYERRICAGVGGINCAAKYVGPCGLACGSDDSPPVSGDFDYGDCVDLSLHHWPTTTTTFLNHPCDVLGLGGTTPDDVLCRTIAALPISPSPL
jgi:hypothetical protein